jgi:CheY-like chemotaxis protein
MTDTQRLDRHGKIQGIKSALEIISQAKNNNANQIHVKKNTSGDYTVQFFSDNGNSLDMDILLDVESYSNVMSYFSERSVPWPVPEDEYFSIPDSSKKAIMFAPTSEFRVFAEIEITNSNLILINCLYQNIPPLMERLNLTPIVKESLIPVLKKRSGLLLTNSSSQLNPISGSSIIISIRPDAIYFNKINSHASLMEAIELSKKYFVVLGSASLDPADMIFQYRSYMEGFPKDIALFSERLESSFVLRRVKRQCGACAKSTNVPGEVLKKLPPVIQSTLEKSYMFSRGCSNCGYSSYRGSTTVSSAIFNDEKISSWITSGSSEGLLLQAYRNGTKSLLEDGIMKVYEGLSSFEEVMTNCPPIPEGYIETIQKIRKSEAAPGANISENANYNLLIVEDDINQREVLELVFNSVGYTVTLAENGKLALDALTKKSFDMIISDVMMPIMNGIDLVREIKNNPQFHKIPILMLTAVSNTEDEYEVLNYGADDYCDKNVKKKILIKRVERLLKKGIPNNPLGHMR